MSKIVLNVLKLRKGAKNSAKNGLLALKDFLRKSLEEMQRDGEKKL